jgi:leader peptidase (prepilin peptidase) / N-methyltransferase
LDSLTATPPPLWFAVAAAFGLVFGSFVTALSYRLPRDESIAKGRSRCPACGHELAVLDLVPVFSWIFHKGVCRHCGAGVSWRYPVIELTTAALFVTAVMLMQGTVHLGLLLAMTPVMVALAVIDIEHERLPNSLLVVLATLSVAWRWTAGGDLLMGLVLAAAVLILGILIDKAYEGRKGHSGLGLGDVKLMATGALALPLGPFLLFMTLAGLLGVVFGAFWQRATQGKNFPFGPAILASLWICLAGGSTILRSLVSLLLG